MKKVIAKEVSYLAIPCISIKEFFPPPNQNYQEIQKLKQILQIVAYLVYFV